jgi:hypothetical protein
MSKIEKIKKTITIALGFAVATYLIMSALAILNNEKQNDSNSSTTMEKLK